LGYGCTQKHYLSKFIFSNYDLVIIWCECVSDLPSLIELFNSIRSLNENTKVLVYGDGSIYASKYLQQYKIDAIFTSGDPELTISTYIQYLQNKINKKELQNVSILLDNKYYYSSSNNYIQAEKWGYPPLDKLPVIDYQHYVNCQCDISTTNNKPNVIAVTVSRGCGNKCYYCPTFYREGSVDRRRPINSLISWLKSIKDRYNYIQFFSPVFTFDRKWVIQFCNKLKAEKLDIEWKASLRLDEINEDIIKLMSNSGCKVISFGVENIDSKTGQGLKVNASSIKKIANIFHKYNISARAYVMIGMEQQTKEDVYYTVNLLKKYNFIVRATGFTPFHELKDKSFEEILKIDLKKYDRKSFFNNKLGLTKKEFYKLIIQQDI